MTESPEQIVELDIRLDAALLDNDLAAVWDLGDQLDGMCERLGPRMARAIQVVRSIHRQAINESTGKPYCVHCRAREYEWPCKTRQAIDDSLGECIDA